MSLNPCRFCGVVKCTWTDITGKIKDGLVYVRDAHAQRIMRNIVIVIPPHGFKQLSHWYYRVWEVKNYEFSFLTYGIISTQNFINFSPVISRNEICTDECPL
jgi:hypothetical protein